MWLKCFENEKLQLHNFKCFHRIIFRILPVNIIIYLNTYEIHLNTYVWYYTVQTKIITDSF